MINCQQQQNFETNCDLISSRIDSKIEIYIVCLPCEWPAWWFYWWCTLWPVEYDIDVGDGDDDVR